VIAYNDPKIRIVLKDRSSIFKLRAREVSVTNTDNGNQIKISAGSPLSLAAVRSGMRLSFQCKAGTCGSCVTKLVGKTVFTCQTVVPDKASIRITKGSS